MAEDELAMKEACPTMIYAPNGNNGGVKSASPLPIDRAGVTTFGDHYWYLVVDASVVDEYLKEGWVASTAELPKKRGPKKAE